MPRGSIGYEGDGEVENEGDADGVDVTDTEEDRVRGDVGDLVDVPVDKKLDEVCVGTGNLQHASELEKNSSISASGFTALVRTFPQPLMCL